MATNTTSPQGAFIALDAPNPLADNIGWIVAAIAGLLLVAWPKIDTQWKMSRFPLLGKELGNDAKRKQYFWANAQELYATAYRKFSDKVCRITTIDGEHVVIPNYLLDELKARPDADIDVLKAFEDMTENHILGLYPPRERTFLLNDIIKVDLSKALARLNPRLSAEVAETLAQEVPACAEWTPLVINDILLRVVAIVSGNIFLGPELCRREEYLYAAIRFTVDITGAVGAVKMLPPFLRRVTAYFLPQVAVVRDHRKKMTAFLEPVIAERKAAMKSGGEVPDDVFQWMMEKAAAKGVTSVRHLADMQLLLTMAAIHTTTLTATRFLYDIATCPDAINDIRKEIRAVLAETDGVMTAQALFNMKLLDSAMRESQRLSPPFVEAFRRYVLRPVTLKDGTHLPKGVFIETPSMATLRDPALYPNPEAYNPYRFYELRTNPATHDPIGYRSREQYQFVSTSKEFAAFGFGKHACPGRFFANNEIKLIMARLLLEYDIKMPNGQTEPHPNFFQGGVTGPDPTKELLFKKVSE